MTNVHHRTPSEIWNPIERQILFRAACDLVYLDSIFLEHGRNDRVLRALERLVSDGYAEVGADVDGLRPWDATAAARAFSQYEFPDPTRHSPDLVRRAATKPIPVWLRLTPRGRAIIGVDSRR